ncbi:MAG: glycosyltransferase family 4 protein [Ferruginibacter sp.]|nr:glycosyltransferase family 4 protein [Ferruginibacter sp.]
MKIVSTSYTNTVQFNDPVAWLQRINFYTGILDELAKNHQVDSIEQINYSGAVERNGVKYHFLNFKKRKLYFPGQLHNHIKALQPDVVLVNGLIFPLQIIQLRLKLGKKVKIILLHRGEKPYYGLRRLLQKMADRCIDAYLFTSAEFGKNWIESSIIKNQNKIYEVIQASSVFYPGNKSAAKSMLAVDGPPVFLWVGRLDANKDPLTVVKAFVQFAALNPEAKLFMIYQTEELLGDVKKLLQTEAKALSAVKLVGSVPHHELQNWYNAADFIISGSHHEGSGIGVCEAMSCGCVPLVTDIISFRKMTGPGKCGLLYRPGNVTALFNALMHTQTLDMEKERAKALQQFNTELSFAAVAYKIEMVLASLKRNHT